MTSIIQILLFVLLMASSMDASAPVCFKGRIRPLCTINERSDIFVVDNDVNEAYLIDFEMLVQENLPPKILAQRLEQLHPLHHRLISLQHPLTMLPMKNHQATWLPLAALDLVTYDPSINKLIYLNNFTVYPNDVFDEISKAWRNQSTDDLESSLYKGYAVLAGKPMLKAAGKTMHYPTYSQIYMEEVISKIPFIVLIALSYLLCFLIYFLTSSKKLSIGIGVFGFLLHTLFLGLRCYILMRPPVSNMYETLVYVPWITMFVAFLCSIKKIQLIIPLAALTSCTILAVQLVTRLDHSLENVQAVLDSQYWLIIHVLMVVGSYGLFALCGMFGHLYLIMYRFNKMHSPMVPLIAKLNINTMYIGTGMLICGTVLGGVWAAQSWGRFWDWDPKESWAFISCCIYLIWIHAYRFKKISDFGLAIGSVIGLHAIIFTWYGVNFILGTGLHSYGFGAGGEIYYYLFLAIDLIFLFSIDFRKTIGHT